MPKVYKDGVLLKEFPYDPRVIAALLYGGYEITPDPGLTPEETETHKEEISQYLREIWGDTQFKNEIYRNSYDSGEKGSAREGEARTPRIQTDEYGIIQVIPNLMNDPVIQQVDPGVIPRAKSGVLQAAADGVDPFTTSGIIAGMRRQRGQA